MKKPVVIGVFLLLTQIVYCQNSYQIIENEICENLENVDFTQSKEALREILTIAIRKAFLKFPEQIENMKTEVKKEKPFASDNEISNIYAAKIILDLIESCDNYVEINQRIVDKIIYPENLSLKLIGNKMCDLLNSNKSKSYQELDMLVKDNLFSFVKENEIQVNKDYKDGIANPDFSDQLNSYLMLNCDLYFKIGLILYGH